MPEAPYVPVDRRPIASRKLRIFQRLSTSLARAGVSPNAISALGMAAGVIAGAALAATARFPEHARVLFVAAAALVQLRLIANLLDGMVAVESGKASRLGELWNEIPDRVSDAATLAGAGYALGGDATLGWLAASVALFVAYVRATGKASGASNQFCGPMAKQQRMMTITLAALLCAVLPADLQPHLGPGAWGFPALALLLIVVLGAATALRRLGRIAAELEAAP